MIYYQRIWDLEIIKFIYVGKSNVPQERYRGHIKHSSNDCVRRLIEEKGADNFGLIILERTNFLKGKGWMKRERGLVYRVFWEIKLGLMEQSCDGWKLA